ncbi:MAG TPA: hypothetical protein VGD01_05560 [Candidatus Elarobacter sp.]|jgi:hypothetical protein
MLRPLAAAAATIACLVLAAPTASASLTLNTSTVNFNDAPLTIVNCAATLADTEFGNVNYYFRPHAGYVNASSKMIVAVKVVFVVRDAFDEKLDEYVGQDDAIIGAGNHGNASWEWLNLHDTARNVTCMPYMARFSDGTTWTNDFKQHAPRNPEPAAPPAAPKPERPPAHTTAAPDHPATCRVTLADKSQIEIPWANAGCANARRAFAARAHPSSCSVRLADGRTIEIPWENAGCADARRAWLNGGSAAAAAGGGKNAPPVPATAAPAPTPAAIVEVDYDAQNVDGHPVTCVVREGDRIRKPLWQTESCEKARAEWALQPAYMRALLWDSHDAAPENLDNGHPKYCTPTANKSLHSTWSSSICTDARLKWGTIHATPPPRPQ